MKKLISSYRSIEATIAMGESYDAQNDANILNDNALLKMVEYLGITGIVDNISEKIENVVKMITPCNSNIFSIDTNVKLIQDFR